MRFLFPILFFLLPLVSAGQSPWPSADSEWNYIFDWAWPPWGNYAKYYVNGLETVQGKSCSRIFVDNVQYNTYYTQGSHPSAYLHFDGDTLWHHVGSDSTFYPLICFDGQPGDSWHPLPFDSAFIDTACTIIPIEILDTFSVNHNGQTYRGVEVGYQQSVEGHLRWGGRFDERTFKNPQVGAGGTLFPFYNSCGEAIVEWYWYHLLCYSDAELSLVNDNISSYDGQTDCDYPWNEVSVGEVNFQFSIYPNPATDNLRLESQTPLVQVNLTDLAGRVALQQTFRQTQDYVSVDVSGLPSGIYLLEAETEDGRRSVQKVVVE